MRFWILFFSFVLSSCAQHGLTGKSASSGDEAIVLTAHPDDNSLNKTLNQAKTLLANNKAVEIHLAAGTYYLSEPLLLGPEFSGTERAPFVIKAAKEQQVVFSGAKVINANWQKHSAQLMKTKLDLEDFDQLYINHQRQHRARYPNFNPNISIFNGYATDAIDPARVAKWKNPVGGILHALHRARWGGMHYEISGVDNSGNVILTGGFQNNRSSGPHRMYRYVENIFEELDAPNEWFYDKSTSTLYYYPPKDLDLSTAHLTVSQAEHLIEIKGSVEAPVKYIEISGIRFTQTKQTFMKTKEPLLRSDWTIYRGGAVFIEGSEHVKITNNEFTQLGGNAVFVNNYNRHVSIASNEIYEIGANAISFIGDPSAVRSASFRYEEYVDIDKMDMAAGPKNNNYPADSNAHDNLIHNIGLIEKQVAGIQVQMAANITASHNSIYDVPRAGINVGEGTWGGHIFEYNDVFNTVLETNDHGAFNSWGRDRFWHPDRAKAEQIAKNNPGMYKLDVLEPIVIRNNRFQCAHGWDIDLDDGSSNYRIYNNVGLSGGLKLREGFDRVVTNNIMINNGLHPHVWFENSLDTVRNNIFFTAHKPARMKIKRWGTEIDYNLFTDAAALIRTQEKFKTDKNSVAGRPMFIDPSRGDYRVESSSPALSIGFKNFPMDQFGVVSPNLKAKAKQPSFPKLFVKSTERANRSAKIFEAHFKSVSSLGEQSALGLPEIAGAYVYATTRKGVQQNPNLLIGDVVIFASVNGRKVKIDNIEDLQLAYNNTKTNKGIKLYIVRNQAEQTLYIHYK
ncbi:right-handed parallel beta-helix repeat-containing protein [Gayadomonas joobiniege]|uniref:right-handed parallel beta-helix repeat-containing protein n=1 Tax=Gayadomonas joobiniege TaxID=1234606 RepID=UPI00036F0A49|nr:right-handed parallel beta-helix repeat-containing protein [Gayadomonas joobiniege]